MKARDHAARAAEILDQVERAPTARHKDSIARAQAHAMTALALWQTVEMVRGSRVPATAGDL